MKLEAKQRLQSAELNAAIPLSLYRKSVSGLKLQHPEMYDAVFNKYGSGNNPKNKYRIYIPVGSAPVAETTKQPSQVVLNYLQKHGFTIDNYNLGTAFMPDGKRTIKIGKVVSRDPEVKKAFDNDPARKAAKQVEGKVLVVISRHPYDILGASFDRGWTSCTNLNGGENAGKFKASVKHGLLVAYLIKDDDRNINRPTARILIRPYFQGSKVALSMDRTEYGSAASGFRATVNKFVTWANSGLQGKFAAPAGMYLDEEPKTILVNPSKSDIKRPSDVLHITDVPLLEFFATSKKSTVREAVMRNPNATPEILALGAKDTALEVRRAVMQNPNATPEILALGASDPYAAVVVAVMRNPAATPDLLALGADHRLPIVQIAVMRNLNATPETLAIGAKSENPDVRRAALWNPNATPELLALGAKDRDPLVREAVMTNRNATSELLALGAKDRDVDVRIAALRNRNATPETLAIGAKDKNPVVRGLAMSKPNATPEILALGAKDRDPNVRLAVMRNPNATPEILALGAKDKNPNIREAVMSNPNATPETLALGVKDRDVDVRRAARRNPKYRA